MSKKTNTTRNERRCSWIEVELPDDGGWPYWICARRLCNRQADKKGTTLRDPKTGDVLTNADCPHYVAPKVSS